MMRREFLITKFACGACGTLLELSLKAPAHRMPFCEGEPTGAAKADDVISLLPCERCIRPAQEAAQALATLMRLAATGSPA